MPEHLFIIGAQRSGTTYLWKLLDAHPEIQMAHPVKPEPKFFLGENIFATDYDYYLKTCFNYIQPEVRWLGEKSTSYIEREDAAQNIASVIPSAKIIVMLRDPVERAISNYFFTQSHGLETYDIIDAMYSEPVRISQWDPQKVSVSPYAYIERGKYFKHISLWEKRFSRRQLILIVAEHFFGNEMAIGGLYRQLGIDATFIPLNLNRKVNTAKSEKPSHTLPSCLYDMLTEKFRRWNKLLADHFELDLSCWHGMS